MLLATARIQSLLLVQLGALSEARPLFVEGEVPWVSFTQATLQKHAFEALEAL